MDKKDYDRFADLCYEAWRQGKNPDAVSEDRYDACRAEGWYPDEISLDMVYPPERNE